MKKLLLLLLIIGCEENSNIINSNVDALNGTWNLFSKIRTTEVNTIINIDTISYNNEILLTFYQNKTYERYVNTSSEDTTYKGNYSLSDSILTFEPENSPNTFFVNIILLGEDSLKWMYNSDIYAYANGDSVGTMIELSKWFK